MTAGGFRKFTGGKLVIATHNAGKVPEIAALLRPLGAECVSAAELNLPEPDETETTFEGNAALKARAAAKAADLPALADDSGLEVRVLGGAPGIYSARWAETKNGRDFGHAIQTLWDMVKEHEDRACSFACALSLAWPDGHAATFTGRAHGTLTFPPAGENGFGYDPVFTPTGHTRTFGEMTREEKTPLTHRARAFEQLAKACFGP
ncbi:MAG: RdgB/HAM1 family non-canonical purine NTP pyrophosphatase [Rhodospirillales bacterium]